MLLIEKFWRICRSEQAICRYACLINHRDWRRAAVLASVLGYIAAKVNTLPEHQKNQILLRLKMFCN